MPDDNARGSCGTWRDAGLALARRPDYAQAGWEDSGACDGGRVLSPKSHRHFSSSG
jgi:hypothetical protein